MKGTDLTPDQLAHAEAFLREVAAPIPVSGAKTTVSVDHLVRVLAWYGAIRAKSGSVVPQPLVSLSPSGRGDEDGPTSVRLRVETEPVK